MSRELDWVAKATGATSARRGERIQSLWSGYGELFRVELTGADVETRGCEIGATSGAPARREEGRVTRAQVSLLRRGDDVVPHARLAL